MQGKFIVIEGCDFTGKSTQIKKIANFFREQKIKHITTREPGGTDFGEQIREIILANGKNINPITELMLFMASRNEHMSSKIMPMLSSGISVVCDRYLASTFIYQGILRGVPNNLITEMQGVISQKKPDLTIILDMEPANILERMQSFSLFFQKSRSVPRFNAYDSKELDEITKIRNGFLDFAEKFHNSHKTVVINANQSFDDVFTDISKQIQTLYEIEK